MPSQSHFDVTPTNVESRPQSSYFQIETYESSSPNLSLDVDKISTSRPYSPYLTLMKKPHSQTVGHHLLDGLLAQQSTFSEITTISVASHLKSISIESVAILHQLIFLLFHQRISFIY